MSSLTQVWRSSWLAPFNDVTALNDLLGQVNATWSLDQIKARVLAVRDETPDTKTFVLRANRRWPGHAAGQHVVLEVEADGVRRHRTFTISSTPDGSRVIHLTVKRQPQGKVTGWMHDCLRPGMVVGLSLPQGAFTLPRRAPQRLLLLSAGSGVTPLRALLGQLHASGYSGDIRWVQVSRQPQDAIFSAELEQLAQQWPALKLERWYTARQGRLDMDTLGSLVPDVTRRETLMCGPADFMHTARKHFLLRGWPAPRSESFGLPRMVSSDSSAPQTVHAKVSKQVFTAQPGATLLEQAENAGLKPKHGCRIGICQTCKCVKHEGTVRNLLTGAVSSEPGELIQLCINTAVSELSLEL